MAKPIDWARVERLQRECFHRSRALEPEEQRLLEQAIREDHSRYRAFAESLREEYAASFRLK